MNFLANSTDVQFNFRKLRQEFRSSLLKEGKKLYEKKGSCRARILSCTHSSFLIEAYVIGQFSDEHRCQVEIDLADSSIILSQCDCSHGVDCPHLACALFYIEECFHRMLLDFLEGNAALSSSEAKKQQITDSRLKEAKRVSEKKMQQESEKISVKEFVDAATLLAQSSLLTKQEEMSSQADLYINIGTLHNGPRKLTEISFAVKLVDKTKPVAILQPKLFFQSLVQEDPLFLGSSFALLSFRSFGSGAAHLLETLYHSMEFIDRADRAGKAAYLSQEMVDFVFIEGARLILQKSMHLTLFSDGFEKPYVIHPEPLHPEFFLSLLQEPSERVLVQAKVLLKQESMSIRNVKLLRSSSMGCLKENDLFLFSPTLPPRAKEELEAIDTIVIPPSLFGSFFSYSLPELQKIGPVHMGEGIEQLASSRFDTLAPRLRMDLDLKDSSLAIQIHFLYKDILFPEVRVCKNWSDIGWKKENEPPFARDISQEVRLTQKMVWGFSFDEKGGCYATASERKISEFFVETLGSHMQEVDLQVGTSLRPYLSMEHSQFHLVLEYLGGAKVSCKLKIKGSLKGISLNRVLEAGRLRRAAVEAEVESRSSVWNKRYVLLGAEFIEILCQCLEEMSPPCLDDCEWDIPLWAALSMDEKKYERAGITLVFSDKILEIKKVLLSPLQKELNEIHLHPSCTAKEYQKEGIHWLRKLRKYFLGGILADDMGLGKTVQAISILSEMHLHEKASLPSLIVCPTSLVDNWIWEIKKFQPSLRVIPLSGTPQERKKIVEKNSSHHVFLASYGLVQKDIEFLSQVPFLYVILDEGQNIKNKETQTARAIKQLQGEHRLILTGTPIENSLDDLWSLFDFLMPSFLGSYERFCHQYVKGSDNEKRDSFEQLKKKVNPFILRRMKQDVLHDLPAITHTMLHCTLSEKQEELYRSFTSKAKEELSLLVEKEGFEKVKLHVLATLTRLKQICCHPLLIQELGNGKEPDSAKYELLFELVEKILASKKKAVIFSQYTKMLALIKQNFDKKGIVSVVLDGSTKNRLNVVQKFNEDDEVSFFLVSLRAGGNGLNLVGADTVIHYDFWWNPAVENQATDRVWRMGQKGHVQSYKLITKGTIEEKIMRLQEQKKDVIANVLDSDEDVLSKLSWNDVLELLTTRPSLSCNEKK